MYHFVHFKRLLYNKTSFNEDSVYLSLREKIKTHNDNLVIGSSQAAHCVDDDDLEGSPGSSHTRLD